MIIAGSRHFHDYVVLQEAIRQSGFVITSVVSGCAPGVDSLGELYALENNLSVDRHPAKWDLFGKAAGPIRNKEMAQCADALIALRAPGSRGTENMIQQATAMGLKVFVWEIVL
jgi:hypothetical protein